MVILINQLKECMNYLFVDWFQPPKIRCFIDRVTSVPLEKIEEPLKGFVWEFDKVTLWLCLRQTQIIYICFDVLDSLLFFFSCTGRFSSLG